MYESCWFYIHDYILLQIKVINELIIAESISNLADLVMIHKNFCYLFTEINVLNCGSDVQETESQSLQVDQIIGIVIVTT